MRRSHVSSHATISVSETVSFLKTLNETAAEVTVRNETFHLGQNEDPWDPLDGGMKDPSATIAAPLATHIDGAAGLSFVQSVGRLQFHFP